MFDLDDIGRLPTPDDNCAIATRTLAAGTAVSHHSHTFTLSHGLLEGHRFAVEPIRARAHLLSWGMPFGTALRDIEPGEVLCNAGVLQELRSRRLDFELPAQPNFSDEIPPFVLGDSMMETAVSLPRHTDTRTFMGYRRADGRGVGTRNMIVLLAMNSLVGGFVRRLEADCKGMVADHENVDGITAVAHTEGSTAHNNNHELLLRTLAGFVVHPNVGAVLVVDAAPMGVTNAMLRDYMAANNYPLAAVIHHFFTMSGLFTADVADARTIISNWLDEVNATPRTPEPLSELKIALQCGGSDAFSGVSGNPLAAWVAKEIIAYGGAANLAETDELVGAEAYVLQKVHDEAVAVRFLQVVARFKEWASWHGQSAEGNPSGGNKYRGLYNIYLKSLGAAAKRHPDVPLDAVIDYSERMSEPGFYFMDSPGNDLESIAGQVAAGCNLIFFVTGNGSITNFPFVPTIKIVTTSARYERLARDMDVDAGAYLTGTPLPELGAATLDLTVAVAGGQRTAGEMAGHAQVQLWRNWALTEPIDLAVKTAPLRLAGRPLPIQLSTKPTPDITFTAWQSDSGLSSRRMGLIVPTSLCSGQIARMAVQRLNQIARPVDLHGFATVVHTEGCGSSAHAEYMQTLLGYVTHPMVAHCLLLEHGCEMTHNDYWRQGLTEVGLDLAQFGWASVQGDGGIEQSLAKMVAWFEGRMAQSVAVQAMTADLSAMRVGLMTELGDGDEVTAVALTQFAQWIAAAGGMVVIPARDALLQTAVFQTAVRDTIAPTLAYAQPPTEPGLHIMSTPTANPTETVTGLGATGMEIVVAQVTKRPRLGHPLLPVLSVAGETAVSLALPSNMDVLLVGNEDDWAAQLLNIVAATLSGDYTPLANQQQNVDFQMTRGVLGISL